MNTSKRGFTLVELLVVMAIVAVLVAMLIPAVSKAKEQAVITKCRAMIKQLGLSALIYSDDFKQTFPANFSDSAAGQPLYNYTMKSLATTGCPGKGVREGLTGWSYTELQAYSFPGLTWPEWGPVRTFQVLRPSQTALGIENAWFNTYSPIYWETNTQDMGRHRSQGMNVVFPDGHAEWLKSNARWENAADYASAEWRTRFPTHSIPQSDLTPPCAIRGCFWHPY